MDAETFRSELESDRRTQLDRIGSNKLLIALTDATLETEAVLRAAADSENAARNTFAEWAEAETHPDAAETFAWARDQEADHRERVLESLAEAVGHGDDEADRTDGAPAEVVYEPADGGTLHSYLRERSTTIQRVAAGLVARPLVSTRTHTQIVSFFVNEADQRRADLFRELKTETEAELDRGLTLLDDCCETEDDWETARMVGEYVIQVSYDDYADALDGLGIDVKPVC